MLRSKDVEGFGNNKMSNKLVKDKIPKSKLSEKNKTVLFACGLSILCIAFLAVWIDVYMTSNVFKKTMDDMVLGVDYFQEEIVITNKRVESDTNDSIHENHFFYYHDGNVHDYHKRMQVPATIYSEYEIGEKIVSYTINHENYSYEKYGILPQNDFRNNELKKVIGVLLGLGIFILLLYRTLDKR